ncbi:RagB/SusD family nutrient uptake outer membrane protein [Marinifilum sp.]|uniref:RagB/SusD family nutrient uptake outer membrane protein n=1 Tax=Marinifilum sp. TaxID=2033137 RepID=UPI003BAC44EB
MKILKIRYYLILMLVVLLGSCNDYFDVDPLGEIPRDNNFNNPEGFYNALNGVYISLSDENLFGHHLTYGVIEKMANNHSLEGNDPIADFDYENVEIQPIVNGIWEKLYNSIALINSILDALKEKPDVLSAEKFKLVKGEALGLRAYLHYTAVKLFAPDYNLNKSMKAIPYVKTYTDKAIYGFSTVEEVYKSILDDLNEAELLLKEEDPAVTGISDRSDSNFPQFIGGGTILENRRVYFNYWAVVATKARVFMSMSDYKNAYDAAKLVLNGQVFDWVNLTSAASIYRRDVIYYSEMITGIEVSKLKNYYNSFFDTEKYTTTQSSWYDYITSIYDHPSDYRLKYQFRPNKNNSPEGNTISIKYDQRVNDGSGDSESVYDGYYLVPLIKKGEMQLIAAEAMNILNPGNTEVIDLLQELRRHRDIRDDLPEMTAEELGDFILEEFRRELYLEGQMFFQYKRLNKNSMPRLGFPSTVEISEGAYVMPIPKDELELNF